MIKKFTIAVLLNAFVLSGFCDDGKTLFRSNCAACHYIGKGKLVGPDLKDVQKKHPDTWLLKWIKSSSSMIKSGDADASAIFNEFNKIPMTEFAFLSDEQIKSILEYIKTESGGKQTVSLSASQNTESASVSKQTNKPSDGIRTYDYIFAALIVVLLLIIWQLSKIIKRLASELIDVHEMNKRFS